MKRCTTPNDHLMQLHIIYRFKHGVNNVLLYFVYDVYTYKSI